jgi:hypothetical protein
VQEPRDLIAVGVERCLRLRGRRSVGGLGCFQQRDGRVDVTLKQHGQLVAGLGSVVRLDCVADVRLILKEPSDHELGVR